jgi:DNA polymerase III subunit beta
MDNKTFVFNRQHLLDKLNWVKGIAKEKTALPILSNVLVDLKELDGKLYSTDLNLTATASLSAQSTDSPNARFTVKGTALAEALAGFSDQEVDIILSPSTLILKKGRSEIGFALQEAADFPEVNPICEPEAATIPGSALQKGIQKTIYAVSKDNTRYALTALSIIIRDKRLEICATDGFRLSLWRRRLSDSDDTPQILLPGPNAKMIAQMINPNDEVGIIVDKTQAQFMTPSLTLQARTITGAFPLYRDNLSAPDGSNSCSAKREALLNATKRLLSVGKKEPICLTRDSDGLTLSREADLGYGTETIDAQYKSEVPFKAQMNIGYLLDVLQHLESDQVIIRYPGEYGAIIFDEVQGEDTDYTCLIMPLRDVAAARAIR